MRRPLFFVAACSLLAAASAALAQQSDEPAVHALVSSFLAAEKAYDAPALAKLISNDYVEVSPLGEVDAHDRFLGFYAPDKKIDWPAMTVTDEQVRVYGDTAVDVLKTTYAMPQKDGTTHPLEFRATYMARREGGVWKLIGAQFTRISAAPAAAQAK